MALPSALSSDPGRHGLLVEKQVFADWTATAQALPEGCFGDTCFYGIKSCLWQIVHAGHEGSQLFLDRPMPWRRICLRVDVRPGPQTTVADVLVMLAVILASGNAFAEVLNHDPSEMMACPERASTPRELIPFAGEDV